MARGLDTISDEAMGGMFSAEQLRFAGQSEQARRVQVGVTLELIEAGYELDVIRSLSFIVGNTMRAFREIEQEMTQE